MIRKYHTFIDQLSQAIRKLSNNVQTGEDSLSAAWAVLYQLSGDQTKLEFSAGFRWTRTRNISSGAWGTV